MLRVRYLRVLYPLCHESPQLEVVLGQQENCELEPADLPDLHVVHPAEGVGEQLAVGGPDYPLEVSLPEVALLLPVQEAEEGDTVEKIDAGERFSIALDGLREEDDLCEHVC